MSRKVAVIQYVSAQTLSSHVKLRRALSSDWTNELLFTPQAQSSPQETKHERLRGV